MEIGYIFVFHIKHQNSKLITLVVAVTLANGVLADHKHHNNGEHKTCNDNPDDARNICSVAGSDGTLVANEVCNKYYICNHGVPTSMSCAKGLLFNPCAKLCDWSRNVQCGDRIIVEESDSGGGNGTCNCNPAEAPLICSANGSDGVLIAHEVCNRFYICDHGVPVALNCPQGLLYNPYTEKCDWPNNVECGDRIIVEEDEGNNESLEVSTEPDTDGGNSTCNCDPAEAPLICSANGSNGVLVSHEVCNRFHVCDHGVPVALNCPQGLLYNPYTEKCDWPHNVECGDRIIVEEDEDNNESLEVSTEPDTDGGNSTCNCDPSEAPLICSANGSDGVLVAHEVCNRFYICDHGMPVAMNCPRGLLYNPYTEKCDWPHNVECGDRISVEEDEDSNEPNTDGGNSTCNCDPAEAPLICSTNGSDGTLVAHEVCNRFYICDHEVPVAMNCSRGLLYNPYTGKCDWPHNVECGERIIVEDDEDNNESLEVSTEPDTDGGNSTCNCDPAEAPLICSANGSDGTLVAHEVCNRFYICDHEVPVAMNCPRGLLYNPYTGKCDWPHNVECGDRIIVEEDEDNNESLEVSTEPDTDGGNSTCNCDPSEAPLICSANGSDGVLVAHEVCNRFYICDHGMPVAMNCPRGLLYNPYTEKCDWAHKVECGDRIIVGEDGNESGPDTSKPDLHGPSEKDSSEKHENGDQGLLEVAQATCANTDSERRMVAHENCHQFYWCIENEPVVISCPISLLYDSERQVCDWPLFVDCGSRAI